MSDLYAFYSMLYEKEGFEAVDDSRSWKLGIKEE